jgi:hypothetical protein
MDLREIGQGLMYWIYLAQDRDQWRAIVNTVMNLQVPYTIWKLLRRWTAGSFSRRTQLNSVSFYLLHLYN